MNIFVEMPALSISTSKSVALVMMPGIFLFALLKTTSIEGNIVGLNVSFYGIME